ncbi:MAG: phosphopantetheine-binding protein [Pirellulaceae bacterium]
MTISSRTPEGLPSHCPLCGAKTNIEFSEPARDAPCPNCGCLLWASAQLLATLTGRLEDTLTATPGSIASDTELSEVFEDSLDSIEMVMELQEEFDVVIPDEVAGEFMTIADVVRYIEARRRGDE